MCRIYFSVVRRHWYIYICESEIRPIPKRKQVFGGTYIFRDRRPALLDSRLQLSTIVIGARTRGSGGDNNFDNDVPGARARYVHKRSQWPASRVGGGSRRRVADVCARVCCVYYYKNINIYSYTYVYYLIICHFVRQRPAAAVTVFHLGRHGLSLSRWCSSAVCRAIYFYTERLAWAQRYNYPIPRSTGTRSGTWGRQPFRTESPDDDGRHAVKTS